MIRELTALGRQVLPVRFVQPLDILVGRLAEPTMQLAPCRQVKAPLPRLGAKLLDQSLGLLACDALQFGLRLGEHPQQVITTTPRPLPLIKEIMADPSTAVTRGSTMDNRGNLADSFIQQITDRYAGTRLGRQELNAEILDDVPGALWTWAMIDQQRVDTAPQMSRVVVAIDPSGTSGHDEGDDVGIVVAGRGVDGRGYVLEDLTCKLSPDGWARMAITAYHKHRADRIVAERNFGGAMVQAVIRAADGSVPYKEVTASRGKAARAEPVSALYEQGRISHVRGTVAGEHDCLSKLEDEMVLMTASGLWETDRQTGSTHWCEH